jgi:hypothetical protein
LNDESPPAMRLLDAALSTDAANPPMQFCGWTKL